MDTVVTLDPQVIAGVVGTLIPILVGLLTKLDAPRGLKAVANAFLSALSGVLVTVLDGDGSFVVGEFLTSAGIAWITSVATYYGLYKPTGTAQKVQDKTAGFGVGVRERQQGA